MSIPAGVVLSRSRLVGIIQDGQSLKILGAAEASFPTSPGASISGRVVNEKGTAAAGIRIQACSGTACVPARSGAGGWFTVDGLASGTWSLALEDLPPSVSVPVTGGQSVAIQQPLVYRAR